MRKVALAEIGGRGIFTASPRFNQGATGIMPGDAVAEAFQAGFSEGQRTAEAAAGAQREIEAAERGAIELAFARFDENSGQMLRERLRATVAAICQGMAAEIAIDPAVLARRVETASAMLRRNHDERVVRLHPADLALIRGRIDAGLQIEPDPSLARGALRVESADGGVEDSAEHWCAAVAEALGTCSR